MSTVTKILRSLFLRTPQKAVVAVLRLVLFIVFAILWLLLRLWKCLLRLLKIKTLYPEANKKTCGRIPEPFVRRPDPCIYSQDYLAAQGLPVTWNNPDIWLAPASNPSQVLGDSYHLSADTDYLVTVQVHNAATDAAIGVRVRLVYRPWSFNSPDLIPVETDTYGHEVVRFVNIAPMGTTFTQFKWRTPKLAPGEEQHYCLQAHLTHPLDVNTANNIGQENTNVYGSGAGPLPAGATVLLQVPLFNQEKQTVDFRFDAHRYQIAEEDTAQLTLEVRRAEAKMSWSDRLIHSLPTVSYMEPNRKRSSSLGTIRFNTPKSAFRTAKTRYVGFDDLRKAILSRDYSLPPGTITVDDGVDAVSVEAGKSHVGKFKITIPADITAGDRLAINLIARNSDGILIGGVTVYLQVGG